MNKVQILVIEDDVAVGNLITTTLEMENYQFRLAKTAKQGIMNVLSYNPDIMLLDLGLPDMDGLEVIKKVRSWSNIPIIVVSARSEDQDKVKALDLGADDYLTKPFSCTELLLRVKALLKRPHMDKEGNRKHSQIIIQDIILDTDLQQVIRDGVEIPLTEIEYRILLLLASNSNHIFTAKEIYEAVWEEVYMPNSTNTVMVHIRNIRKKLGDTGPSAKYLHNIWGRGYRIV